MNGNFTLFTNSSSGGGGSAADYLKDNFLDTSVPANSNLGFSSTITSNPLSGFFANDDAPRFSAKTLFIKDMILLPEQQWQNNKPTYQIEWTESQPHVHGYVVGNARLKNDPQGRSIDINGIGDIAGVTGVIRKLAWIVNPSTSSPATAELYSDGVDTTNSIDFSNQALNEIGNGVNHFTAFLHSASLASKDIHDYQLNALQYRTLNLIGVIVYFEDSTLDIDQFPGTTYVDKNKETSTNGMNLPLPVIAGRNGAKTAIAKTTNNTYQLTTVETPYLSVNAQGASGTNLVDVDTGFGGSFPVGSGVVGVFGTSFYVGSVSNQSTDTLTVTPTLPFGISGLFYKAWQGGPTFAVSATLYGPARSIDPFLANRDFDPLTFCRFPTGDYYYQEPCFKYRIWSDQLQASEFDGYKGFQFNGNTTGFFQVDGYFSSAEIEFAGAGILNADVFVNGALSWSINEGFSGIAKKTVFTEAGPGWNSFYVAPGQSLINVSIVKINLYERLSPVNVTVGLLSILDSTVNYTPRFGAAINASLMPLGNLQRTYADSLFLQGQWTRGATHSQPGGIYYSGASTNSTLRFQYYGTDFGLIGTAGTSAVLQLDGASIAVNLNVMKSVPTLGFHTVQFQNQSGTSIISAIDFLKPSQTEIKNTQNFLPRAEIAKIPKVFNQSDTPRNPKDGDLWAADNIAKIVWIYLFGKWNRFILTESIDDPNDIAFFKTHGATTAAFANASGETEVFNFVSWITLQADSVLAFQGQTGNMRLRQFLYYVDGINASGTVTANNRKFNKISYSSDTTRATPKCRGGVDEFINLLHVANGSNNGGRTGVENGIETYDGISWALVTSALPAVFICGAFTQGGLFHVIGGTDVSANPTQNHATWNGSAYAASTNYPVATTVESASRVTNNAGFGGGQYGSNTDSYVWNGSTWSSAITMPYVVNAGGTNDGNGGSANGFNYLNFKAYINGGNPSGSTSTNNSASFNGTSWMLEASSNLSISSAGGAIL